jgi:hypothetical protein
VTDDEIRLAAVDWGTLSNSVGTCSAELTIDDLLATQERLRAFESRRDDAYAEAMAFIRDHLPGRDPNAVITEAIGAYLTGPLAGYNWQHAWTDEPVNPFRVEQRRKRRVRMARKRRRGYV